MTGVIQTGYGVNSASFSKLPSQSNGILATMIATAGVDLSNRLRFADNQGNNFSRVGLFEIWDMVVGHQCLTIGFYGVLGQPSAPKGTYTVSVSGMPTGANGGAAGIALLEVNGLQSLDQTGTNGQIDASNSVATGTSCPALNTYPNDLVIAALGVPDTVWANAPRYPPALGYTGVISDVISPQGSGMFAAVQASYKVVQAVETSLADWGAVSIAGGYKWPWVSAVASFSLATPRTNRLGAPPVRFAVATAPLAWVIRRRRKRALESSRRRSAAERHLKGLK
jgi:hypothetical protein